MMSFVLNDAGVQQLSILDTYHNLTEREKRFLGKSWAKYFAEHIFPRIDERPYEVLYSTKDSRPNTPVNVQIGALILKEMTGQSDEALLESMLFDVRFQYALHTTSCLEQPMSDRTLGRFRERCMKYEKETGIDLLHHTITALAQEMAEMVNLDLSLKRMDSLMVESNIKRMGRLELLYTCTANLAREIAKREASLPEELKHYTMENDRNLVIYHNRSEETANKISTILKDAAALKELCGHRYDDSENYRLLVRALEEQAIQNEDGTLRLRTKEDGGMNSSMIQNPADPDATYREKAGKQHHGYTANVTEAAGENVSLVLDYQYEQNTYSDSQFMKDSLEKEEIHSEQVTIVADGAYAGKVNEEKAAEKNIQLITTNLTGREADDILADFEFNEEGTQVVKCAGGCEPKSCSYNSKTGQCAVSFHRSQCEQCSYRDQCHPKIRKHTCRKTVSANAKRRAEQQRYRSTDEFKKISNSRNGVESIPSILRRKYHVDHIPVRKLIRSKMFFGFKIAALNIWKLCRFWQGLDKCTQNTDFIAAGTNNVCTNDKIACRIFSIIKKIAYKKFVFEPRNFGALLFYLLTLQSSYRKNARSRNSVGAGSPSDQRRCSRDTFCSNPS